MRKLTILKLIPALLITFVCYNCTSSQSDEKDVMAVMEKFKNAVEAMDIEKILANYSENFESDEAKGIDELRIFWQAVKDGSYLEKIEVNLENALIEVSDDTALVTLFNDEGKIEIRFELKKEDGKGWLITGSDPWSLK